MTPAPSEAAAGRPSVRIIHTSDVHLTLSSSFPSISLGSSTYEELAFTKVIDAVDEESADLLLIAGDLFESNRVDDDTLSFVGAELSRISCPVVLIPGNHDCYSEQSVYRRFDFRSVGRHVHPLTEETGRMISFDDLHLAVWGKALVDHDPENRPLYGLPKRPDGQWFVGLAHGYLRSNRRESRSSVITPEEIADSGLDYLALGHVHVFRDVSQGETRACYPGAPALPYSPTHGSLAVVSLDSREGVRVEERKLSVAGAIPEGHVSGYHGPYPTF